MPLDRSDCFNVPDIFSAHRLTICYPPDEEVPQRGNQSQSTQVGEKRKQPEVSLLEEEVAVNALLLAPESEVFEKLFTSELQGSGHPSVTVESAAENDVLIELLRFCYTTTLPEAYVSDSKKLLSLLVLADRFGVAKVIDAVAKILQSDASVEVACRILNLPSSIQEQEAMRAVVRASKDVIQSELGDLDKLYVDRKFEGLFAEVLQLVLESKTSKVRCENTVFAMVWTWAQGDPERLLAFPSLSKHIRYHQITSSFLCAIQHLPEAQSPEVASQISSALLFLGIRKLDSEDGLIHRKLTQDEGRGYVPWRESFEPRSAAGDPFVVQISWVAPQTELRALADQDSFEVVTKQACGYKLVCKLVRRSN